MWLVEEKYLVLFYEYHYDMLCRPYQCTCCQILGGWDFVIQRPHHNGYSLHAARGCMLNYIYSFGQDYVSYLQSTYHWSQKLDKFGKCLAQAMRMVLTKIVCTIGPRTSSREKIKELIDAGMSIARLNFSHGSREAHLEVIRNIRDSRSGAGRHVSIALDTRGPEVRLRTPEMKDIKVEGGEVLRFSLLSSEKDIWIPGVDLKSLGVDNRVFIDDGAIELRVVNVEEDGFECEVLNSGMIKSNKSMNFPGTDIGDRALGDEDKNDIAFGLENGIDMVFASFVSCRADVEEIRRLVGSKVPVVSKIESCLGMRNLKEIALCSDGVMIARGDLGVEIGLENMFSAQKRILYEVKREGRPVICATQMMESMTLKNAPNRSEISDVGNAVLDGCDCVMLSAESAVGMFPVETVKFMRSICADAERYDMESRKGAGACGVSSYVDGVVICSGTESQIEKIYLSKPETPIIVISESLWILRRFSIYRGIIPVYGKGSEDAEATLRRLGLRGRFLAVGREDVRMVSV
nr:pyruvate kinase [Encephalitozoon cuniculi]